MVLASKFGSQVSFQPDKNFQQSFASWVKQGQNNNSGKSGKDYGISTLHPCTVYCTYSQIHVCEQQCAFSIFAFAHMAKYQEKTILLHSYMPVTVKNIA